MIKLLDVLVSNLTFRYLISKFSSDSEYFKSYLSIIYPLSVLFNYLSGSS